MGTRRLGADAKSVPRTQGAAYDLDDVITTAQARKFVV